MLTQRAPYILAAGITLLAVVIVAAACLSGGGGGGTTKSSTNAAAQPTAEAPTQAPNPTGAAGTPDEALANFVTQSYAKAFVADCTKVDPSKDAGKVCATLKGEREGQRAYQMNPVGAAPTVWVVVDGSTKQWVVVLNKVITPDNAAVPGIPWPLKLNVDLVVVGANPCVNVRVGAALNQPAVDCIRDGTKIQLTAGPTNADSIQWWQVTGRTGWVSSDFLRYPDAAQ